MRLKAAERCKCDSRNLLGFVYRKLAMPRYERSEKYYMEALEECPGHCEARSYLGELYLQTDNKTAALETFNTLVEICGAEHASVTSLVGFWEEKGWCHPLSDSEECAGDDVEPTMASPPATSSVPVPAIAGGAAVGAVAVAAVAAGYVLWSRRASKTVQPDSEASIVVGNAGKLNT